MESFLENGQTMATFSASKGNIHILRYLLDKKGMGGLVFKDKGGDSCYTTALRYDQTKVIEYLFKKAIYRKNFFLFIAEDDQDLKRIIELSLEYVSRTTNLSSKNISEFFGIEIDISITQKTPREKIVKKVYRKFKPSFFQRLLSSIH